MYIQHVYVITLWKYVVNDFVSKHVLKTNLKKKNVEERGAIIFRSEYLLLCDISY